MTPADRADRVDPGGHAPRRSAPEAADPRRADPAEPDFPWVDRAAYPFTSRYLCVPAGRMHYLDEGPRDAPVILLVHGTPVWSFVWRHVVRELAADHRVIAPDHLGFGLSERPRGWGYTPADHAAALATFVDALELDGYVPVVHDFGGPIGLSGVLDHPERVRGVVLLNTWMWSLEGTPAARMSRLLSGHLGRFLYRRLNASPRFLIPAAFGDRRKLDRAVHQQYIAAFPTPEDRTPTWVLARELLASSEWYQGLWSRRAVLARLPALLLWGMKDPAFGPDALAQWREALPQARAVELEEAGHFVQEEAPAIAAAQIRRFVADLG
ncbi:MAG: alpha/beta fold hydrolase [Gemmatimonadota bacterium]